MLRENEQDQLLEQDSSLLGQIMETDIWLEVATTILKRCDNLNNLNNSSPFFRNLFGSHQDTKPSLSIFNKVFEILVEHIWKSNGPEDFPLHDLLNCRQVCKQWNQALDSLLANKWNHKSDSLRDHRITNMDNGKKTQVLTLLSHFNNSHPPHSKRNPLISRKLIIGSAFLQNDDQGFLEGVTSMISKYGTHIVEFSARFIITRNDRYFVELSKWLVGMPNLVNLSISNQDISLDDAFNFEGLIAGAPYPKLKRLKFLSVEEVPNILLSGLINQNSHISTLSIGRNYKNENINFSLFPPMPNLNTFKLNAPQNIASLTCSRIQCEKLRILNLTRTNGWESVRWSKLFEAILANFANSLEMLSIEEFGKVSYEKREEALQDSINCRLNLPKLQVLELFLKNPISLDFVLSMKDTLQILDIESQFSLQDYSIFSSKNMIIPLQVVQAKCSSDKSLDWLLQAYNIRISCFLNTQSQTSFEIIKQIFDNIKEENA